MELVEVKCGSCGKDVYVLAENVREKMFCTLECLNKYKEPLTLTENN